MQASTSRMVLMHARAVKSSRPCLCRPPLHPLRSNTNIMAGPSPRTRSLSTSSAQTLDHRRSYNRSQIAKLMGLYHQASYFPDFSAQPTAATLRGEQRRAPEFCTVPPALTSYISTQINSPVKPMNRSAPSALPDVLNGVAPQHDVHGYMEEELEPRTMYSDIPSRNSPTRKWQALSSSAPRHAKVRALKMLDVLFGTVNVRQAGVGLVEDVCRANEEFPRPSVSNTIADEPQAAPQAAVADDSPAAVSST